MFTAGQTLTLPVTQDLRVGLVLARGESEVLLPRREVPDHVSVGDELTVFLYTDTEDRLSATLQRPLVEVGQFACLQVVDVTPHGAFLDWGLDKDLFLPFGEMFAPVHPGQRVVVHAGLGARGRVVASSKLNRHLDRGIDHLKVNDEVALMVYGFNDFGALVLVDKRYGGLLHDSEIHRRLSIGDELKGWVKELRPDGRIEVRTRPLGLDGVRSAQATILEALQDAGGHLPLHDKSKPAEIERALRMSKKAFKRAVGGLYREGRLRLVDGGIELVEP